MKEMIPLDMDEYLKPQYSQQEKEARLYSLAKKLKVKFGRDYEERNRSKNNRSDN